MAGEWAEPIKKCCLLPQRYVFGIMGFFSLIMIYLTRICLSIAITEMVTQEEGKAAVETSTTRKWSEMSQGIILGSFYWGYVASHLPGGLIAERWGAKHVLNGGVFLSAVLTLLTPVIVRYLDWPGLVVIRIIEGLGQGTTFPALAVLLAHWVPLRERSRLGALVLAGNQIGSVVGNLTSGFIIEGFGTWESVFYVFGGISLLWCIMWHILCYSDPSNHPFIKDKEKNYLANELVIHRGEWSTPWYGISRSLPVWSMVIAEIGHDWILFSMVNDLPKYIKVALDFSVSNNGLCCSAPYLFMWICSMASGFVVDWLTMRQAMELGNLRKLFTGVGAIAPAIFILGASYAGRDQVLVVALFIIAMGSMGPFYAGIRVNPLDLSPNYAGTVMALVNGLGALSGIATPWVIGVIVGQEGDPIALWRLVFWITFGVAFSTTIVYIIWGSGKVQYWNDPVTYHEIRNAKREAKRERARQKAARRAGNQI